MAPLSSRDAVHWANLSAVYDLFIEITGTAVTPYGVITSDDLDRLYSRTLRRFYELLSGLAEVDPATDVSEILEIIDVFLPGDLWGFHYGELGIADPDGVDIQFDILFDPLHQRLRQIDSDLPPADEQTLWEVEEARRILRAHVEKTAPHREVLDRRKRLLEREDGTPRYFSEQRLAHITDPKLASVVKTAMVELEAAVQEGHELSVLALSFSIVEAVLIHCLYRVPSEAKRAYFDLFGREEELSVHVGVEQVKTPTKWSAYGVIRVAHHVGIIDKWQEQHCQNLRESRNGLHLHLRAYPRGKARGLAPESSIYVAEDAIDAAITWLASRGS